MAADKQSDSEILGKTLDRFVDQLEGIAGRIRGQAPYFAMALGLVLFSAAITITGLIAFERWSPSIGMTLALILPLCSFGYLLWLLGLAAASWSHWLKAHTLDQKEGELAKRWKDLTNQEKAIVRQRSEISDI